MAIGSWKAALPWPILLNARHAHTTRYVEVGFAEIQSQSAVAILVCNPCAAFLSLGGVLHEHP
jgi:hypothetical protein